jgi:hypothetical protein
MSETKWRIKKEPFASKINIESNIIPEDVNDDGDTIVDKIEQVKLKAKGFSKLPALDDIYNPVEGFRGRNRKAAAKSQQRAQQQRAQQQRAQQQRAQQQRAQQMKKNIQPDKKAQLKELMNVSNVFSGKEFNVARQIRDFAVKYAKYADIFYDVEVIMSKIHKYIVSSNKLESTRSALWFYQSMNRSRFNLDKSVKILTDSEINIALEAEYEVLSPAKKQPYIDMMNKHKAKYEKALGVVNADADLIVSAIRGFSMTLICILICYNILYTWIHCEGKGFGNLIRSMNDNLPSFLTFIAKPAFTAMTFIENAMNMPKVVVSFMDPVKLYLGMFAIVTYTGIFQSISKSASKLMVDSLTAILKGQFSKSPMVYILIVVVWAVYFGGKIIENPGFIAGVVPVFLIGLIFLFTVIVSSLVLAPYFGLAISGYVVYRLIYVIPLASAIIGMFNVFDDIDIQSNPNPDTNTNCSFECIKHYVQTMQFYIKNLFTIIFSLLTIKTIIQFSAKLNNKNLKIALPTIMSFLLLIGLRKKYNSRCNPPEPPAPSTQVQAEPQAQAQIPVYSNESEIVAPPMPTQTQPNQAT